MSESIIPIQSDATGLTIYQKTELTEVREPVMPAIRTGSLAGSQTVSSLGTDHLSLTSGVTQPAPKPVKKRIEQKTSYFTAQQPAMDALRAAMDAMKALVRESFEKAGLTPPGKSGAQVGQPSYNELIELSLNKLKQSIELHQKGPLSAVALRPDPEPLAGSVAAEPVSETLRLNKAAETKVEAPIVPGSIFNQVL